MMPHKDGIVKTAFRYKIKKQPGYRHKFPGLLCVTAVMGATGLVLITADQRNSFQLLS
jgi:hypothetical protein